jgi:hypothetical protein
MPVLVLYMLVLTYLDLCCTRRAYKPELVLYMLGVHAWACAAHAGRRSLGLYWTCWAYTPGWYLTCWAYKPGLVLDMLAYKLVLVLKMLGVQA